MEVTEDTFIEYLVTKINYSESNVKKKRNIIFKNIKNILKEKGLRNNTFKNLRNVLSKNQYILNILFNLYDTHFFNGYLKAFVYNKKSRFQDDNIFDAFNKKYISFSFTDFYKSKDIDILKTFGVTKKIDNNTVKIHLFLDILEILFNRSKYRKTYNFGIWVSNILLHIMITFEHELIHAICFLFLKGDQQYLSNGFITPFITSSEWENIRYNVENAHSKTFMSIVYNLFKHKTYTGNLKIFNSNNRNPYIITPNSLMTPPSFDDYYKCPICNEVKQKNDIYRKSNLCKQCLIQDNEYVCASCCQKHIFSKKIRNTHWNQTGYTYNWQDANTKPKKIYTSGVKIFPTKIHETMKYNKIHCPNGKKHKWIFEKKYRKCNKCKRFNNIWCKNSGCCGLCYGIKPFLQKEIQPYLIHTTPKLGKGPFTRKKKKPKRKKHTKKKKSTKKALKKKKKKEKTHKKEKKQRKLINN